MFKFIISLPFLALLPFLAIAGGAYDDSVIATNPSLDPLERSMRENDKNYRSKAETRITDLSRTSPENNRQVEIKIGQINEELEAAQAARAEAERLREEGALIARKRSEAHKGHMTSKKAVQSINPIEVMSEQISFDSTEPLTIHQIVKSLMPPNWDVRTDFHNNPEIGKRRYSFTSTRARDLAIRSLLSEVSGTRVTHHYMWDLVDEHGNPKPVIIISDKK